MTLLFVYVTLALAVSFLCSILEAVLLSLTPSYIALLRTRRPRVGRMLESFKNDIDRPLSAILSLNTIAHTVGATGAGAQAVRVFGEAWVGVISAVLTLLILVLSEIVPKTLGATYWRALAPSVAYTLRGLVVSMAPLVWLSQGITRMLSRDRSVTTVSREELAALAESGWREGVFEASESHILQSLMRAAPLRARDVMTPRVVVGTLPESRTIGDIAVDAPQLRFSRIPVHGEHREDLTGYVRKDELLIAKFHGENDRSLQSLRRSLLVVPESLPLVDLFEQLLAEGDVVAQVIDEHGGLAGLVTMEDVVETFLGLEIVDELDSVEDMRAFAQLRWKRRARELGLIGEEEEPDPGRGSGGG
jgi:CBS domain containing-hemolysin-like protein